MSSNDNISVNGNEAEGFGAPKDEDFERKKEIFLDMEEMKRNHAIRKAHLKEQQDEAEKNLEREMKRSKILMEALRKTQGPAQEVSNLIRKIGEEAQELLDAIGSGSSPAVTNEQLDGMEASPEFVPPSISAAHDDPKFPPSQIGDEEGIRGAIPPPAISEEVERVMKLLVPMLITMDPTTQQLSCAFGHGNATDTILEMPEEAKQCFQKYFQMKMENLFHLAKLTDKIKAASSSNESGAAPAESTQSTQSARALAQSPAPAQSGSTLVPSSPKTTNRQYCNAWTDLEGLWPETFGGHVNPGTDSKITCGPSTNPPARSTSDQNASEIFGRQNPDLLGRQPDLHDRHLDFQDPHLDLQDRQQDLQDRQQDLQDRQSPRGSVKRRLESDTEKEEEEEASDDDEQHDDQEDVTAPRRLSFADGLKEMEERRKNDDTVRMIYDDPKFGKRKCLWDEDGDKSGPQQVSQVPHFANLLYRTWAKQTGSTMSWKKAQKKYNWNRNKRMLKEEQDRQVELGVITRETPVKKYKYE